MTVKKSKSGPKKSGGAKKKSAPKSCCKGGALYQSGNGFLSSMLPGPLGALAGFVGLGKHKKQKGGIDLSVLKPYLNALLPVLQKQLS